MINCCIMNMRLLESLGVWFPVHIKIRTLIKHLIMLILT